MSDSEILILSSSKSVNIPNGHRTFFRLKTKIYPIKNKIKK